ncbi:MAG: nucleotidyltransferase domain-containing protein [Coprobacillus sp.]|nr:nucleotidyltransferase domain-containing protein [Coprobacillus sp.]
MEMTLKELRTESNLTQAEASVMFNMPLRTYQNYENDPSKIGSFKYDSLMDMIHNYIKQMREEQVLTIKYIKNVCQEVLSQYDVDYVYLFGSYAKGYATKDSDVDLFIKTPLTGLDYAGIYSDLYDRLYKKIDLLNTRNFLKDPSFVFDEIMKDGIKIYG